MQFFLVRVVNLTATADVSVFFKSVSDLTMLSDGIAFPEIIKAPNNRTSFTRFYFKISAPNRLGVLALEEQSANSGADENQAECYRIEPGHRSATVPVNR